MRLSAWLLVGPFVAKRNSRPWIALDERWSLVEPLLPVPAPRLVSGRPRVPDRQALCGILFVLHTGIQWEYLPHKLGFGSGMTCWRRLAAWNEAGVSDQLRPGSKHHVLVDGQGIPLAVSLTGGNRNDVTQLPPLLAKIPSVAGPVGRPRRRPDTLLADRGYDHDKHCRLVWAQGIKPVIARRSVPHGSGLGIHRWAVERTIAWLHGFRRLRVRWERHDDIHETFLGLATCLITHRPSNAFVRTSEGRDVLSARPGRGRAGN
ncbi:IS5 family transposase [Streptomyces hydrogenans]